MAARRADRRAELLDRAEEVGPDEAVAELVAGHMPGDVIEHDRPHQPRPGGLVEAVLAAIWPPLGHGP